MPASKQRCESSAKTLAVRAMMGTRPAQPENRRISSRCRAAIENGHLDVHEDEVESLFSRRLNPFPTIHGNHDVVSRLFEYPAGEQEIRRVVFNQKDSVFGTGSLTRHWISRLGVTASSCSPNWLGGAKRNDFVAVGSPFVRDLSVGPCPVRARGARNILNGAYRPSGAETIAIAGFAEGRARRMVRACPWRSSSGGLSHTS